MRLPGVMNGARRRHGQTEVNQLDSGALGEADEVAGTDVAVDVSLLVDVLEGLRHVADQLDPLAGDMVFLLLNDDVLQAGSGDVLHHDDRFPFERVADLVGLDHVGVLHAHGDFPFARLFQPFEAALEEFHLLDIEDLHADQAIIVVMILGHKEVGHRAGDRRSLPAKASLDVDSPATTGGLERGSDGIKQTHGAKWTKRMRKQSMTGIRGLKIDRDRSPSSRSCERLASSCFYFPQ